MNTGCISNNTGGMKVRKYKLELKDDAYNKLEFVDDDLYTLCQFMEKAMRKSIAHVTATISIVPEESEVGKDAEIV